MSQVGSRPVNGSVVLGTESTLVVQSRELVRYEARVHFELGVSLRHGLSAQGWRPGVAAFACSRRETLSRIVTRSFGGGRLAVGAAPPACSEEAHDYSPSDSLASHQMVSKHRHSRIWMRH